MNLAALTLARNEGRFIGFTGRVALKWCDQWVVLLHACTDNTKALVLEIAKENPGRVHILEEPDSGQWDEMDNRQHMLEVARGYGATHMALVDGDEVINHNGIPPARELVFSLPPGHTLRTRMVNLCDSIQTYRNEDSVWGRASTTLAFADHPTLCWKARDGYQYHHREPFNTLGEAREHESKVLMLHMQMVSRPHLLAKHAWYKMMERVRYPQTNVHEIDVKYTQATLRDGIELANCPSPWINYAVTDSAHLHPFEGTPWHLGECYRMLKQFGNTYFQGLNLFGVV